MNPADYANFPGPDERDDWDLDRTGRSGALFLRNVRTGARRICPLRRPHDEDPRLVHPLEDARIQGPRPPSHQGTTTT